MVAATVLCSRMIIFPIFESTPTPVSQGIHRCCSASIFQGWCHRRRRKVVIVAAAGSSIILSSTEMSPYLPYLLNSPHCVLLDIGVVFDPGGGGGVVRRMMMTILTIIFIVVPPFSPHCPLVGSPSPLPSTL